MFDGGGGEAAAPPPEEPEREDPSEFITHRAKEFLSGMKEIEGRFLRAADCGGEITRMLEATKIKLGGAAMKGKAGRNLS